MSPKPITDNTLFYGDNLTILRDYIPTTASTRSTWTHLQLNAPTTSFKDEICAGR
jgi:hypothetical protein